MENIEKLSDEDLMLVLLKNFSMYNNLSGLSFIKYEESIRSNILMFRLLCSNKINIVLSEIDEPILAESELGSYTLTIGRNYPLLKLAEIFSDHIDSELTLDELKTAEAYNSNIDDVREIRKGIILGNQIASLIDSSNFDDLDKAHTLASNLYDLPSYVSTFVLRVMIGFRRIANADLDEVDKVLEVIMRHQSFYSINSLNEFKLEEKIRNKKSLQNFI